MRHHRRPRSLFQVIGFDAVWRKEFTAKTGEGLLTNPVPAPVPVDDVVIDERLAIEPLMADGEPLH